jgi:hypothetical protein
MKRLLIILLTLLIGCRAGAQLAETGINPFKLEVGSRPLALGAAFVGLGDDVDTVLYNPGGQAWVKGISLTIKDFENVTGVMAFPTGNNSSLGLAVVSAKISGVPISAGTASSNSSLVLLSYGTKLNFIPFLADKELFKNLGFGLSLKGLLGETLGRTGQSDRSATGWDMDLGVLWRGTDWWSAGASLQNFLPAGTLGGGRITWDYGGDEGIPASLKLGGSAKVIGDIRSPVFIEGRELNLAGEMDISRASTLVRLGGEWGINKTYYLRTGVIQQDKPGGAVANLSLGVGYRSGEWGFDIARAHEPLRNEDLTYISCLYFPKDWIVQKKLDVDRPALLETALQKISLTDNLETYDDRIEVVGQVKAGVDVYVNDARAVTGPYNEFKVTMPLQLGKNLIVVEARYEGEKKDWQYKVLRKAKIVVTEEKTIKQQLAAASSSAETEALKKKQEQIAVQKQRVEELVTLGVVEVTPGAEFRLDASLTRGDLAAWLAKASGARLPKVENDLYSDVKKDNPLAPYIKVVVDAGLLKPFPDGTFRPELPVTKDEGNKLFQVLKKAAR